MTRTDPSYLHRLDPQSQSLRSTVVNHEDDDEDDESRQAVPVSGGRVLVRGHSSEDVSV